MTKGTINSLQKDFRNASLQSLVWGPFGL